MTSYEIILYIMSSHMRIVDTSLFDITQETESKVGILLHVGDLSRDCGITQNLSNADTIEIYLLQLMALKLV